MAETAAEPVDVEVRTDDAPVTTQPAITTEDAEQTDVELSPVGDEKVEVTPREVEIPDTDVEIRSVAKREIDVRLLPWGVTINTNEGLEEFARGASVGTPDDGLLLMGLEHEAHIALGQQGQPMLARRPAGRSFRVWEDDTGAHASFKVAKTASGDEILALAEERVIRGVSVEFAPGKGQSSVVQRGGRRVRVHTRAALTGASLTYRPAYGEQAAVLAVRSQQKEAPMGDPEVPVAGAELSQEDRNALVSAMAAAVNKPMADVMARLEQFEERYRTEGVTVPGIPDVTPAVPEKGVWAKNALLMLHGDRISEEAFRLVAEVTTVDNVGVVPPAYLTEIIGIIDASRPFLATTRRLPLPDSGMIITVPVIEQRPTTAVQAEEKDEVSSQKTIIGTTNFEAITIAGVGDLSIQLIRRSSPSFLSLWLELLAEAYAIDAEDQALRALFNATGGVGAGTALNAEDLNLGAAFVTSFDAIRRPPDTIWMSTEAVGEFIDAKATTTNQPLYPGLSASATAAGGIQGTISGLRAVHVPGLDAHGAYAIVGPSSGFAWTEDGTYTLQVDIPSKAGRDVGIVGMLWPMPWYPAAFSLYNVAS